MKLRTTMILPILISSSGCMLQNDPPRCDSKETRSIIESILSERNFINGNGCARTLNSFSWAIPVANESECPVGTRKELTGNITSLFGNDFESTFTSFVIKSETIPNDGLSVSCSFGLEAHIVSKSAHYDQRIKYGTLQLTLFKKNENGETPYEYIFDKNNLLTTKAPLYLWLIYQEGL